MDLKIITFRKNQSTHTVCDRCSKPFEFPDKIAIYNNADYHLSCLSDIVLLQSYELKEIYNRLSDHRGKKGWQPKEKEDYDS